jgi:hypothetical protein
MSWLLDALYNWAHTTGFVINSLPKSGTNLVQRLLQLLPGVVDARVRLQHGTLEHFRAPGDEGGPSHVVGVGWPQQVAEATLRRALQQLGPGRYALGHFPHADGMARLMREHALKTVLVLRDPRDVAASHARYARNTPQQAMHRHYQGLSEEQQLMTSIVGHEPEREGEPRLLSIEQRCRAVLGWRQAPQNYTTTFEQLVGARGGGSAEAQLREVKNILAHIGARHAQPAQLASRLFGGTRTFAKGLIGGWREHFNEDHRRAFKELAGELLVELGYERDLDW